MPPRKRPAKPPVRSGKRPKTVSSRTCTRCGRTEPCPEGGLPKGWSMGFERRRTEFLCASCARANIRAIEGRLTEEYWEF